MPSVETLVDPPLSINRLLNGYHSVEALLNPPVSWSLNGSRSKEMLLNSPLDFNGFDCFVSRSSQVLLHNRQQPLLLERLHDTEM
jgi:hypothetical protein